MKTIYLFLFLILITLLGCKEEKKIEIITDYNQEYLPYDKLDKTPQLVDGNADSLIHSIFNIYNKKYPVEDKTNEKPTLEYRFLINENGSVDKVIVGNKNDQEINQLVLNTVKDWKYTPAEKNNKVVKSLENMILWQTANLKVDESEYQQNADEMPEPVGGLKTIQEKIVYPENAKQKGIEGKVFLTAFINEVGNVVSVKIIKGFNKECEDAAMQAVLDTKFTPGKQNGKAVKTQITIPIVFKLH